MSNFTLIDACKEPEIWQNIEFCGVPYPRSFIDQREIWCTRVNLRFALLHHIYDISPWSVHRAAIWPLFQIPHRVIVPRNWTRVYTTAYLPLSYAVETKCFVASGVWVVYAKLSYNGRMTVKDIRDWKVGHFCDSVENRIIIISKV